jgi:carbonic anhydrase/acetyltransferase-like protein (isoleucine patch superfamily)
VVGRDVTIGHGAAIAATRSVVIGDRTRLGPFCVIMDTDFHGERARVGSKPTRDASVPSDGGAPIEIGSDVKIGAQVTVLRGSHIGDGAVIEPGSVVNGRIAAGAVARGVPALAIDAAESSAPSADRIDVARIIASTFALAAPPSPDAGPEQIPEWDSLGALKLVFSLEEALGRTVDEHLLATARTVEQLQSIVNGLTLGASHEQ